MKGEIQIWDGDKLLHTESNMIVDGAGELIADVMTISPSLSGTQLGANVVNTDAATSSILDASNYTIQAISFGTGSDAFNKSSKNAQALTAEKIHYIVNTLCQVAPFGYGATAAAKQNLSVEGSGFVPEAGLPEAPNPSSRVLEHHTDVSASFAGSGVNVSVSSIFPGNGQHVNFLPSAIGSSMMAATEFSALVGDTASKYPSSLCLAQSVLGAFPIGSSTQFNHTHATTRSIADPDYSQTGNIKKTGRDTFGYFNEVSSMDVSGFVNMVMSGSPGTTAGYAMSSPASGLCVSGGQENFSGVVEYSVELAGGDLATVNLYGGIYHLGLWTIDMNASLQNGNTPPFAFSILNNPRKYKLFARKGLSKNLCYIKDNGNANQGFDKHTPLTIKWRIHFI